MEVEGRTLAGTLPKLTTKGVVDGKVVISVKIDWYGNVSEATALADESTITNESVINAARSAAFESPLQY